MNSTVTVAPAGMTRAGLTRPPIRKVMSGPPFPFHIGQPALPGAFARALGDPTSAGDGAETITFTAGPGGRYQYVCPMPGHAQMGMHGSFIVK